MTCLYVKRIVSIVLLLHPSLFLRRMTDTSIVDWLARCIKINKNGRRAAFKLRSRSAKNFYEIMLHLKIVQDLNRGWTHFLSFTFACRYCRCVTRQRVLDPYHTRRSVFTELTCVYNTLEKTIVLRSSVDTCVYVSLRHVLRKKKSRSFQWTDLESYDQFLLDTQESNFLLYL